MKKKWIIKLSDVPQNCTVEKYILNSTDIRNNILNLGSSSKPDYLSATLNFDYNELLNEVRESLKQYGSFYFNYKGRESQFTSYLSTALTWNPQSIDSLSNDPHQSSLGSSKYSAGNSTDYENIDAEKNSYADTYSFNKRTPISEIGLLNNLLNSFERTIIRSRISVIKANEIESTNIKYLWHQDESIFINLRVNIPVQSSENYVIQFLDEVDSVAKISEIELAPGKAYVYDTQKYHRPFCKKISNLDRINIICGVSPWFDYHSESNSWHSNEFYGEVHPFDMFQEGHISPLISK